MGSACPVTSVKGGIILSRDENKKSTLGEVNQQGMILDAQRSLLGYVSEHGFVYDSKRELLGYVSRQGVVRDANRRIVGQVNILANSFPFLTGKAAFFLLQKTEQGKSASDVVTHEESTDI